MAPVEFLVLLLVAVAALAWVADLVDQPYPVLLVVGGLLLGLVPGLPEVRLDPDVVLLIFLPPLLYHAAFLTSPRELRSLARPVGTLAVGLTLVTMLVIAVVAHELVGRLSWAEAFVLGAVVGPTDPVAATTVLRRLGIPGPITTILEGESLVNDGAALTALRVALAAATAGTFNLLGAGGRFVLTAVGGILIGLAAGWLVKHVRRRVDDAPVEISLSLFTPYLAYVPAERVGASGVLAAVTVGLYLAYQSPTGLFNPSTRLQALAFWDVLVFLANSLLFILVGLQLPAILDALGSWSPGFLAGAAALVCVAVIATRLVWMLTLPSVMAIVVPRRFRVSERPGFDERVVLGWSGMRGAVSLAAALSIPYGMAGRPLILFLTYVVILVTLVGQGMSLPWLGRRLAARAGEEDEGDESESEARAEAARAALDRLSTLAEEQELPGAAVEQARRRYELRLRHLAEDGGGARELPTTRDLQRALVETERETIERLHIEGRIDQATSRRLERELDLEEQRWREQEGSPLG